MYGDDTVEEGSLVKTLIKTVHKNEGRQFVWICNEWDNFFREPVADPNARTNYIELLRSLFKDTCAEVFAAAYMAGILPMIKMKDYSALTEFDNFTMFFPKQLAPYIGFTEDDVKDLLQRNHGSGVAYEDMAEWYEGYGFPKTDPTFNPQISHRGDQQQILRSFLERNRQQRPIQAAGVT